MKWHLYKKDWDEKQNFKGFKIFKETKLETFKNRTGDEFPYFKVILIFLGIKKQFN